MFKPKWKGYCVRDDGDDLWWREVEINRDIHAEVFYGWRVLPNAMALTMWLGFVAGVMFVGILTAAIIIFKG